MAGADISASFFAVGGLTALVSAILNHTSGRSLATEPSAAGLAVLHGAVILSIGFVLFARGARVLSGVTLTLRARTETVLAPSWSLLAFGEPLTRGLLLGGMMVMTAVVLQTRSNVARPAASSP